jgi:hypothetical protein
MRFNSEVDLPIITSSERADYKRCPKRWYWKWRRGLVPRRRTFGALDFGTWMHEALAQWYQPGIRRSGNLADWFEIAAHNDLISALEHNTATEEFVEQADELIALGIEMAKAYQEHYDRDKAIRILRTEIPLEYTFSSDHGVIAAHKLKPDAVFMDQNGDIWLLEHKTAKQVMLEHLVIDDQARPYGAMAERALIEAGLIKPGQKFRGILYNVLRKALPDLRPQNSLGHYLNKDGTVSKRQPSPFFVRKHVTMTQKSKIITLNRLRDETAMITLKTLELRLKEIKPEYIPKTPHKSCAKTCPFFTMCVAEENGVNIRDMERMMYNRADPYLYHTESTEDQMGFEIA